MKLTQFIKLSALGAAAIALVGCGAAVEVPPAHVGKVQGKNGYEEAVITTSKFRLDWCWVYCDDLVNMNVADQSVKEPMELFMPKDKLTMAFDYRMTLAVNPAKYEMLFNKVPPSQDQDGNDRTKSISWGQAYQTYAQQIVRTAIRQTLAEYTIAQVASEREEINAILTTQLSEMFSERTPFLMKYGALADVKYPEIIVTAQEAAAERREAIQQEQAQLEISKVALERQLQEQQMQRKIDVERAAAEAEVAAIQAKAMTPAYQKYRELDIMSTMAASENKVFMPLGMLDTVGGQMQLGVPRK